MSGPTIDYVRCDFARNGFVHDWLLAGPVATPVSDLHCYPGEDWKLQIAREYRSRFGLAGGGMPLSQSSNHNQLPPWSYVSCGADHYVDRTGCYEICHYLFSLAYTIVFSPVEQEITALAAANGPVHIWINGIPVFQREEFYQQIPQGTSFRTKLAAGLNRILVCFEAVAARECPYAMALRLTGLTAGSYVAIPVHRDKDSTGETDGEIAVSAESFDQAPPAEVSRIPGEEAGTPGESYSEEPYGTYETRRVEALTDAARRQANVFSEIAKMALGEWDAVDREVILQTIEGINQRGDCSDFYLAGLLGMAHRYGSDPCFPEALREPLEHCVLHFRYWSDEPGTDSAWYWSENHQILFHTCEILAGQLYPDKIFPNVGETGRWHLAKGERMALSWLAKRGATGFIEWDSNTYFEHDVLALSHLADLARNHFLRGRAAGILTKLLFTMALNSFKGTFGSTHGRTYTPYIKGGRLETTSGIGRLLWGMGTFNRNVLGTVSLACATKYTLPPIIREIASDRPEEYWGRERHGGVLEFEWDREDAFWEVNKVTFRTPDYMLSSAQDYRAGERGGQQHIWQATLGPDAVVFVSHPPCLSEEGSHRPGFWVGNVILPRVAQWKDVLIAVHQFPEDDWMGFTHAYFPSWAFDEHAVEGSRSGLQWLFGRKGDGYIGLAASSGLEVVRQKDGLFHEIRSHGHENVWICQMGRAAHDGNFAEFQEKILKLECSVSGLSVHFKTLRGESLQFGWTGPFLRNGLPEPLGDFPHYDTPYCVAEYPARRLEVRRGEQILCLDFEMAPQELP